jgi:transcriptional regulator with XRE-family HTH domain
MAVKQRAMHVAQERATESLRSLGREIRLARRSLGLSLKDVGAAVGVSGSTVSRIERALAPSVAARLLNGLCAAVGLELSMKAFPGGRPIRDAEHAAVLERLRTRLHSSLRWRTEVPLPIRGDLRGWDAMVSGPSWRYGVEAERNPIDGQAMLRRLHLKQRDGLVDGVILLLPDTRQARHFRRTFAAELAAGMPVPGRVALQRLGAGHDPAGSALIVL